MNALKTSPPPHTRMASRDPPPGCSVQLQEDGSPNPRYVDLLDEDKPVAGQRFCCLSFLSPEKVLARREEFMFAEFVKQWDLAKSLEKFHHFTAFLAYKYKLDGAQLQADLKEFVEEEKSKLQEFTIAEEYKSYLDQNEDALQKAFDVENVFTTSVRGIKVRGSYPSQEEAELRCKMLREQDPNHDVYVGPVGMWVPWHPEAYKTGRVEYMEAELNQLMHEKKQNEAKARKEFDARVKEAKEKAMKENEASARETGNPLTQTMDKDGNLVSVTDAEAVRDRIAVMDGDTLAAADIRKELFDSENIATGADESKGDDAEGE